MRRKIQSTARGSGQRRKNSSRRVAKPPGLGVRQIQPDLRLGKRNSSEYLGPRVRRFQLGPQRTPFLNFPRGESRGQAWGCRIPFPTIRILPLYVILGEGTALWLFHGSIHLDNFLHQLPRREDGRIFHRFFCERSFGKSQGIGRRLYGHLKLFRIAPPPSGEGHRHGTSPSLQWCSPNPPGSWMNRQPRR